ncbi:MAG: hypothetical protein LBS89_02680 [Zoogloeaceae bacterium]|jgi:hypothetical protein|nr:hypothetical protein [Zoogloeaceae bacterium]
MQRLLTRTLFCVALVAGIAPGRAQTLTPEAVADLYLKAYVNNDLKSARQLNAYLRPFLREGVEDPIDTETLDIDPAQSAQYYFFYLEGQSGGNEQVTAMEKDIVAYYTARETGIRRSICAATGTEPGESEELLWVRYRCKMPRLTADRSAWPLLTHDLKKSAVPKITQMLREVAKELRQAPVDQEVDGALSLIRGSTQTGSVYWTPIALPAEARYPIVNELKEQGP